MMATSPRASTASSSLRLAPGARVSGAVLMALATSAVVLLTARSGLDTHRDTIDVLHMLGSTDVQVSRLFQRRIALDTLIGGSVGTVAAMIALLVIGLLIGYYVVYYAGLLVHHRRFQRASALKTKEEEPVIR